MFIFVGYVVCFSSSFRVCMFVCAVFRFYCCFHSEIKFYILLYCRQKQHCVDCMAATVKLRALHASVLGSLAL